MIKVKNSLLKSIFNVRIARSMTLVFVGGLLLSPDAVWAQRKSLPTIKSVPQNSKQFTYDLSASSGTTNGNNYSEVNLGLNWYLTEWLNWRNSIFSRFGSNIKSVSGLDSSILAGTQVFSDDRMFGVQAYIGPGVRLASEKNTAATADAGVIFTLAGLRLGVGAKALQYFETRQDSSGGNLPKSESQYYIVLAGGGGF